MSETPTRTPEQIQADLEATREQMSATVDQLVANLRPEVQLRRAKEGLATKVEELRSLASQTFREAREGDPEAVRRVGKVALGVAAAIGVCLLRRALRKGRTH